MNASRFDAVSRSVAAAPRRQVLAALAGGLLAAANGTAAVAARRCASTTDCPHCQYCRAIDGPGECHKCKGKATRLTCEEIALCRPNERCPGESCTSVTGECCVGVCNGLGRCQRGGCVNLGACSSSAECCFGRLCINGECTLA
jgi:hypothetical protein